MENKKDQGQSCNLYENPMLYEIYDGAIRPGGLQTTKIAMELCHFEEGARILDIGCGCGVTVEYLQNNYNIDGIGIDLSTTLLEKGRERNPDLKLFFGNGEMMDFPPYSFDGVFMECVLSLMDDREKVLRDVYRLLKKGGQLALSDFYIKESHEIINNCHWHCSNFIGCDRIRSSSDNESACCNGYVADLKKEECKNKTRNLLDGAYRQVELISILSDIGYSVIHWKDKNKELKEFTAALIFQYGSLDAFYKSTLRGEESSPFDEKARGQRAGYFLLIAKKYH